MGAVALVAATLTVLARPVAADQYTDRIKRDRQEQQQANSQIARLRAQIAAAQNKEAVLQGVIAGLDVQIVGTQAQIAGAKTQLSQIQAQLAAAKATLAAAEAQLAAEKRQLSRQVIVIYELQQQSTPLNNLMSSGDFNSFWTSVIDGRRISDAELQTVGVIRRQQAVIQGDVAAIAAKRQQQEAVLASLDTAEAQLLSQRSVQQAAVNYLAQLQAQDRRLALQWQAAYNTLNTQIAKLQSEEAAARAAGGGSGRFSWPDTGPISQGFGCTPFTFEAYDPACPQKHFHNGIDIAGACGNDITAADAGIAHIEPYESWGFGNYIIIVHGNGWETLYGHLAGFAIRSGQVVHRGQLIGWEGTTGNSTGCHLHFGVNHNGTWVNPLSYLS